ncbi:hypothetical protein ACFL0U_03240 [Pseudomonadota bacterium]
MESDGVLETAITYSQSRARVEIFFDRRTGKKVQEVRYGRWKTGQVKKIRSFDERGILGKVEIEGKLFVFHIESSLGLITILLKGKPPNFYFQTIKEEHFPFFQPAELMEHNRYSVSLIELERKMRGAHAVLVACELQEDESRVFFLLDSNGAQQNSNTNEIIFTYDLKLEEYRKLLQLTEKDRLIFLRHQVQVEGTCQEIATMFGNLVIRMKKEGHFLKDIYNAINICTNGKIPDNIFGKELSILTRLLKEEKTSQLVKEVANRIKEGSKCGIFPKKIKNKCNFVLKYVQDAEESRKRIESYRKRRSAPTPLYEPQPFPAKDERGK